MAAPVLIYTDLPGGVPATYRLPPGLAARLSAIAAEFNGSGASGSFYPCLAVYSQDDKLIGRFFPAQVLAAGDTAEVTFAPFLRQAAASAVGSGIQFDTDNQGGYLDVTTNDRIGGTGRGLRLTDSSLGGIEIKTIAGVSGLLSLLGTVTSLINRAGSAISGTKLTIRNDDDGGTDILDSSGGLTLQSGGVVLVQGGASPRYRIGLGNSGAAMNFYLRATTDKYKFRDKDGTVIFQIDADGALHGLTGQALTFDL